ncbi:MAG: hypothetical protein K8T91_09155 [Planctomycetes bacterium]|nr:hypothetical protein [Planctomycetota bacterium]
MALAAFAVTWDPCSLIGGCIMLPWPLALGIQQYRGTFRRNAKAGHTSAISLFVIGGLGCLILVAFGAQLGLRGRHLWLRDLLPIGLGSMFAFLAGRANLQWARLLRTETSTPASSPQGMRFSLRELFLAVTLVAVIAALVTSFVKAIPPRFAEHVDVAQAPFGLPPEAKDVSYFQGYRGTIAYEFTIDEAGFRRWVESGIGSIEAKSANVSLEPIEGSHTISTYHALTSALPGPEKVTLTDGLYYGWSKEDRGVHAAFDRVRQRAYYFAHYH